MNNKLLSNHIKPTPVKIKIHYIASLLVRKKKSMEGEYRDKQRRNYATFKTIYDITMSLLFLAMAAAMFFPEKLNLETFVHAFDPTFRKMFGAICVLYGAFRLYRGLKKNY